jgi:hypothetical protein
VLQFGIPEKKGMVEERRAVERKERYLYPFEALNSFYAGSNNR